MCIRDSAYWTKDGLIESLPERRRGLAQRIQATFPKWKNVSQFADGSEVLPGITAVNSFGHTLGHTSFRLSSGGQQVLLLGDAIIVPALFLSNLDWQLSFDTDRDMASATRKAIVQEAVADNITIAGYHFGFPNSGKIEKDGKGYAFHPHSV